MTVQCPRKSSVSCIVPLTTAFMSSSRACLHLIAQASQPFAMVEPTYEKSGWLSRRLANSMCWWRQEAEWAISCSSNLASCRTRKNPDLFQIKSKSVWLRSTLASPRANLECERTQLDLLCAQLSRHTPQAAALRAQPADDMQPARGGSFWRVSFPNRDDDALAKQKTGHNSPPRRSELAGHFL